jgi:hypothetical protein
LVYWSLVALLPAVLGDALLVAVVVGGALLVASGEVLLVPKGDVVVVSWAAAGLLGCTSASQVRREVKPAISTNTTTASVSALLPIMITFYAKWEPD